MSYYVKLNFVGIPEQYLRNGRAVREELLATRYRYYTDAVIALNNFLEKQSGNLKQPYFTSEIVEVKK